MRSPRGRVRYTSFPLESNDTHGCCLEPALAGMVKARTRNETQGIRRISADHPCEIYFSAVDGRWIEPAPMKSLVSFARINPNRIA